MINKVIHGDCLEVTPSIPDKSIDMILCDLPYGTTACKWDTVIPFEPLWKEYKRIIKDNGAIVLTASQPFTSVLVCSNLAMFRYEWIWVKGKGSNFYQANFAPLKAHENVIVFSKLPCVWNQSGWMEYHPIKTPGEEYVSKMGNQGKITSVRKNYKMKKIETTLTGRFPLTVVEFGKDGNLHPTQKPVALFEYLIKTYTNEGETVLDNCAGSGTTAIACLNTNRKYILIEQEQEYINIINKRIAEHEKQETLF